jgi:hypothetical protein
MVVQLSFNSRPSFGSYGKTICDFGEVFGPKSEQAFSNRHPPLDVSTDLWIAISTQNRLNLRVCKSAGIGASPNMGSKSESRKASFLRSQRGARDDSMAESI